MEKEISKAVFAADLHGNKNQYSKLFDYALSNKIDVIILGGDLAPKDVEHRTIEGQRSFFLDVLFPMIKDFNGRCGEENHFCVIYLMMGNDDFRSNHKLLEESQEKIGFNLMHNKCFKLNDELLICGYSYVPLTPFKYKDWEKLDLIDESEERYRDDFVLEGAYTEGGVLKNKKFDLKNRGDTIEKDLFRLLKDRDMEKFILVTHSPPYDTCLDSLSNGSHVGSKAVLKIINEIQPVLSLHGHIHETVDVSGKFKEKIGDTISVSAGNDHLVESLKIICFDLNDYSKIERKEI